MPRYLIKTQIDVELEVNCENLQEAQEWSTKIVAELEDYDGNKIPLTEDMEFNADSEAGNTSISLMADVT